LSIALLHGDTSPDLRNVVEFIQYNSEAVLSIISATVKCPNNKCGKESVLYDSGAQVSMIRDDFAKELETLGQESKPVTIFIAKLGETEHELNTKLNKVPMYATNGRAIQTIGAVGVSQISHDTTTINVNQISEMFGLPKNEFHRKPEPIDILIGINYPTFYAGKSQGWSCSA
jgi:hypothetical protein